MVHMVNNIMKTANKENTTSKFWEVFMQDAYNKEYIINSFIPQPCKEMKELTEDSKNPISTLSKLTITVKEDNSNWNLPTFTIPVEGNEPEKFLQFLIDDYALQLFKYILFKL